MESAVRLTIAASIEAVAAGLAGGSGERGHTAEHGEARLAGHAVGVVAGRDEDLTGDLRSDAESLGKARVDATYESFDGRVEGADLSPHRQLDAVAAREAAGDAEAALRASRILPRFVEHHPAPPRPLRGGRRRIGIHSSSVSGFNEAPAEHGGERRCTRRWWEPPRPSEKLELIRLVEGSSLSIRRTLTEILETPGRRAASITAKGSRGGWVAQSGRANRARRPPEVALAGVEWR